MTGNRDKSQIFIRGLAIFGVFILLAISAGELPGPAGKLVKIDKAWSPETPPGMTMSAGYFSITNISDHKMDIVAAESPLFASIKIHKSTIENGVSSMHMVKDIVIAPRETIVFEPGALHLMMMRPTHALHADDSIPVTLDFADGTRVNFDLSVVANKAPS